MLTEKLQFKIDSLDEMTEFAKQFAACLKSDDCVCLTGDLGAGKTTFTNALVHALGFNDLVSSPTFNILHEYSDKGTSSEAQTDIEIVYHFDTYRLETPENFLDSALDSYFGQGLCLVEWGELIKDLLSVETIYLAISYQQDWQTNVDNGHREITLTVPAKLTKRNEKAWQALVDFGLTHRGQLQNGEQSEE